ncbi:LRR receptor-like serine/threonine-protein kinase ERL1 isoform X2 [Camellia sinensis]|uniref:LRR receptor-like serine/threonine-protein kinase ERL1 isoform X2 n=1 Tax=Camellia sinensis TaxID=4442 RepID=UPI001036BC2F|nr:LRR receptor-like serine/threonine-protein kinase ERL1 isoform X2 [Camellia sinensis]
MEEALLFQKKTKKLVFYSVMLAFMLLFPLASPLNDEGKALMSIKASFNNIANVLLDWDDVHNDDFCSWRGVFCDNITLSVVSLNLSNLNLGGEISPAIGDLKNLQSMDFQGNKLTGQIPDEIGNCVSLMLVDLSDNLLYGDIPFSISKLKQLELLNLKNNQLTGPIPSTLTQIPNLKTLDLARNQLIGEIPRLIYWNEVLQYLGLRGNSLTGTLSPDMCQLTGLWYFDVRGNNLTGTIPDNIGNCTSFEILDISYNQISGEIPYNIGFLQVATLSLQGNRLTGKIPEVIGLMQALAVLDLSENELVGPIPPILGNLSYTGKLYLHGNKLTGPIPPELGNMSKLSYLQLNGNQLVGGIPAELGKLEQLFELNLANNNLEGPIPHNISSCTALNQFNVYGNRLSGSIPLGFQSLESLTYLNLSSNHFKGSIPVELGRIINLDTLDLSSNNFLGPVPASIGDLEHLLTLNLSHNHLNGPIPSEFGILRSIQIIDMSFNNLSGHIPEELGQLQNIASLILNNNNLRGEIPDQLTNCLSLATLNVSYNNLSGIVPPIGNFSRFSPDSFIGNPLLCGNWFGSVCHPCAPKSKAIFSRTMVVCITLGFVILLGVVIVALYKSNQLDPFVESKKSMQGPPKLVILHMDMAIHTYEDIMRITENMSEKYIIGYGASSTVYKCILKNSRPIAIKRIYTQQPHNFREFETELETVGSIRHRNLVSLHGYALTPYGNLLFYDYMENGSLWDLLHGPAKKVKLDWETRLKIAIGAAQGLAYLHHDCNPRIIHRDVKSSNILLDENFEAHLSDFGIAKSIPTAKTHASTYVLGTIGYIDPEYARTSRLNEKSDVYSFGVVLLELLTGKKAVDNESNLHQLILAKADDNTVMEAVDPEVSVTCMDLTHVRKTFQLALLCTKRYPSERPTMHEVARVLISLLPAPPAKASAALPKTIDYALFVIDKGQTQLNAQQLHPQADNSSSDAQWFVRFREVISKNTH